MNVGSLFSGIGGIELGFEREGFRTLWFIEKDRYAQEVIRKHWRDAIIYDDITEVDFRTVPKVDILTGGFPCQDISIAGRGVGITGSRSSLWKYYKEAIGILRPKYAFIENVPILTDRGFNVVLSDIASIGYDAEWYCVPASSVGAFHRRNRIYIVSYPSMCGCVHRQAEINRNKGRKQTFSRVGKGCPSETVVSYGDSEGLERSQEARDIEKEGKERKEQPFRCDTDRGMFSNSL